MGISESGSGEYNYGINSDSLVPESQGNKTDATFYLAPTKHVGFVDVAGAIP